MIAAVDALARLYGKSAAGLLASVTSQLIVTGASDTVTGHADASARLGLPAVRTAGADAHTLEVPGGATLTLGRSSPPPHPASEHIGRTGYWLTGGRHPLPKDGTVHVEICPPYCGDKR